MSYQVIPFGEEHVEGAAALVSARYRELRGSVSSLPPRYDDPAWAVPLLRDFASRGPGVVVEQEGRMLGFLMASVIPSFRGRRTTYSPEWANGADRTNSREIYQRMYTALSSAWVGDGCTSHLITLFADDRDAVSAWFWEGFGLTAVDAIRDLTDVGDAPTHFDIRRASPDDVDLLLSMAGRLEVHLRAAPTFLARNSEPDRVQWEKDLQDDGVFVGLASDARGSVAYMKVEPASGDACRIIMDEGTASVTAAFTEENIRGRGVATALLSRVLEWVRSSGRERCAVDFEPMNAVSSRFWLRHFEPVCYTALRTLDENPKHSKAELSRPGDADKSRG